MTLVVAIVIVALLVALTGLAWLPSADGPWRRGAVTGLGAGLAVLGLVAVLHGPVVASAAPTALHGSLLVGLFVVAVAGGGPVTAAVLRLADSKDAGRLRGIHAEQVLRGGAWIGAFERAAVFAALVAGWPEGLAVVLALKGLGRYSELRADAGGPGSAAAPDTGGVAERFIIGTFSSVLWAVACAGVLAGLMR